VEIIKLSEFIKTASIDIACGFKEANSSLQESEGHQNSYFTLRGNRGDNSKIPGISFDIAVSVSKNQKDKAGFMVPLATIGGRANTEKGSRAEMTQRINKITHRTTCQDSTEK
jgi:hypothetical protein